MSSLEGGTQEKRRVAIYIRVSTAEQKMDGYSMEAQEKRLVEYVEKNEALNLQTKKQWIYKDVHTGSDLNREKLNILREDVKAGKFDAVLVWKIDRLSRSLKHLLTLFEEMQKNEVSFISVQENIDFKGPIGNLIFQIFGAIAQFERELIKGRTKMGKIASAEMGNFTGTSVPYAYRAVQNKSGRGRKIVVIPEEKKWVERMFEWYIFEDLGFGQVASKLNHLEVPPTINTRTSRAKAKWTESKVKSIIQNTIYRGEFTANDTDDMGNELPEDQWTVVAIPPCVSEFTFQQAEQASKDRVTGKDTDYLLSGKLIDMDLEKPRKFTGAKRYKGGFSYRRKQIKRPEEGIDIPVFEIPGEEIEKFVWGKVMEALKKPDVFIKKYLSKQYRSPGHVERLEEDLRSLRAKLINEELAVARIEEAYEQGRYSADKMETKIVGKGKVIEDTNGKIQDLEDQLALASSIDVEVGKLKSAAEQVKYQLDKLDRKRKKILCRLFIDRVEMRRRKQGKRWKINAEVVFRFNPQKFEQAAIVGRTNSPLTSEQRGALGAKNQNDGGR